MMIKIGVNWFSRALKLKINRRASTIKQNDNNGELFEADFSDIQKLTMIIMTIVYKSLSESFEIKNYHQNGQNMSHLQHYVKC